MRALYEEVPGYLVIGHVTDDVGPGGRLTPGGTACYSALYADRLGARVAVLTSAVRCPEVLAERPSIQVCCHVAPVTTTFENIYYNGQRRQYVRAVAAPLTLTSVPRSWRNAGIVHLGPLVQEVDPALAEGFPGAVLGVTPQGWLRSWDDTGLVSAVPWRDAERVLARADVVVLSMEDLGNDGAELRRLRGLARLLVVTDGRHGALVCRGDEEVRVRAFEVDEVDPTGAGDVFAAAYFVRLHECRDPIISAQFANCVASFVVESVGTTRVPTRADVEERLRNGRQRA
jgi:1D-myo-inositol 3-kinase